MIETSLRRFEVERKSYLASRPVFLLDQILHLVWLERTTVKYNTYKIVTFHPSQLLLHFQIHFLSTIWHFIEGHPSSTSKNIALFTRSKLRETVFWMVSVTPYLPQEASDTKFWYLDPLWNSFLFLSVKKKFKNYELEANERHFSKCYEEQLIFSSQAAGKSGQEEKLAATPDKTFFWFQTFARMFLSLLHISCKKLTKIHE